MLLGRCPRSQIITLQLRDWRCKRRTEQHQTCNVRLGRPALTHIPEAFLYGALTPSSLDHTTNRHTHSLVTMFQKPVKIRPSIGSRLFNGHQQPSLINERVGHPSIRPIWLSYGQIQLRLDLPLSSLICPQPLCAPRSARPFRGKRRTRDERKERLLSLKSPIRKWRPERHRDHFNYSKSKESEICPFLYLSGKHKVDTRTISSQSVTT